MNELHAILDTWRKARDENRDAVLATVVHVSGSAYRRPGARMLMLPDGTRVGSISGGCLEGDVSQKAWWLTEDGKATLRVYDTMSEEDIVWEFGLGCNGIIQVLLERLGSGSARAAMEFLDRCRSERADAVVCTVIRAGGASGPQVGGRLFASAGKLQGGTLASTPLEAALIPHCERTFLERKSRLAHLENCEVFVEWVGQPVPLVIFGAGHDAIPLVNIAKQIGWHVTVADGRPAYAKASRFPGADRVVHIRPDDPLAGLDIGPQTAVVLMTHNYPQDGNLLRRILPLAPRYLGILGPKARTSRLFAEIGAPINGAPLNAPVGLDIGADTPETIALSIAAEIQAVLSAREGGMLKLRDSSIHAPVIEEGASSVPDAERIRFEFGCELASSK
jgi:xanthine dehydrogenase accessory factor